LTLLGADPGEYLAGAPPSARSTHRAEGGAPRILTRSNLAATLLVFALSAPSAQALAPFSVRIGAVNAPQLHIKNLALHLQDTGPAKARKLALSIDRLASPHYNKSIHNIAIRCHAFKQSGQQWRCTNGIAKLSIGKLKPLAIQFDARLNPNHWDLACNAAAIPAAYLTLLPLPQALEVSQGSLDLDVTLSGAQATLSEARFKARLKQLSLHTKDGRYASENLQVHTQWLARHRGRQWRWRNHATITGGAFYADPLYWEAGAAGLTFYSQGSWRPDQHRIDISRLHITQGKLASVDGSATLDYRRQPLLVRSAQLAVRSQDLTGLSNQYLKPFTEQSQWAGLTLNGQMAGHLTLSNNQLSALTLGLTDFAINDQHGRFGLQGGRGIINWSNTLSASQTSYLQWTALHLGPVPIGAAQLNFASQANRVWLPYSTRLPLLGGVFTLTRLVGQKDKGQDAQFQLAGQLADASLRQLSESLGGPPLTGLFSGEMPWLSYRDGLLELTNGLSVRAFDGTLDVGHLAVSDWLSGFPQLSGDMTLDRLELGLITDQFQFGKITGRLSGFIRQLRLENWRPVQFFAWLGTPDDDSSRRRISQKAVKNIASIGGATPADIAARGLLKFFAAFGYDKIGLGCYLNDGVCQLMGIGPIDGGYHIIKGSGLPRIDVIGHNTRVDWDVLLERLRRAASAGDATLK